MSNWKMGLAAVAVSSCMSAAGHAAITPYVVDANTVLLYHLDAGSGNTAVDSANGLNLTANPSPYLGASGPAGLGGAATFPESSAGYQLARTLNSTELALLSTTEFTIEAWVRNPNQLNDNGLTSPDDHDGIFQYRNAGGNNRIEFSVLSANNHPSDVGKLQFAFHNTAGGYVAARSSQLTWEQDMWYHVAVTYTSNTAAADDSTIKFYRTALTDTSGVPGLLTTLTNQVDIKPLTVGSQLRIGGLDSMSVRSFGGNIDEVRYSNIARDSFNLETIPEPAAALVLIPAVLMLHRRR